MKLIVCGILIFISCGTASGQLFGPAYANAIKTADSLYKIKKFKQAALVLSESFQKNGNLAYAPDRHKLACCYALDSQPDSAFLNLFKIAKRGGDEDREKILNATALKSLHSHRDWLQLTKLITSIKEEKERKLNRALIAKLDSIFTDDQQYRLKIEATQNTLGFKSKEMTALFNTINTHDSLNLIKVRKILDTYGWLGSDVISEQGNTTLFLVIQHSDLATQQKYLPMMRNAVKAGNAESSSLALLEDRVALEEGRNQLYGSQIGYDDRTKKYYVLPLSDPKHVDERRNTVGLNSLSEYVKAWKIDWKPDSYQMELEEIKKGEKKSISDNNQNN